ncbi:hypothetical protein Pint_33919 [Pistacia integerrima]|uniref:Uncharacterized protein n=1 Tax=Pistacia integerrima TaxID=434235 RepID=A0ACC0X7G1_9ROSI|nr:hypothetical protein Pint_33919 [Pistacia integerrima]
MQIKGRSRRSTKSILQWGSSFVCCSSSVSNMLFFFPPGALTQQLGRIVEDYLQLAKSVLKHVNVEEELCGNSFMERF